MSGGDKQDDDSEDIGFHLDSIGGAEFEAAIRDAEQDLQQPIEDWRRLDPVSAEEEIAGMEREEPLLTTDVEEAVVLKLTVRDSDGLMGDFSGSDALQAATPAEVPATAYAEEEGFVEIPRSGAETLSMAEEGEDWLAPMEREEPDSGPLRSGLTASEDAVLIGDFSGAEEMPHPEPANDVMMIEEFNADGGIPDPDAQLEEDPAFINENLADLSPNQDSLLADFGGSGMLEDLPDDDGGLGALGEMIFSSGSERTDLERPLQKVTERSELDFIFKD